MMICACLFPLSCAPRLMISIARFSLLEKHAPLHCHQVRADSLEPRYRDVKEELEAAKKHKRWAERRWVKTTTTVNKQTFTAAKRLVAKIEYTKQSPCSLVMR